MPFCKFGSVALLANNIKLRSPPWWMETSLLISIGFVETYAQQTNLIDLQCINKI